MLYQLEVVLLLLVLGSGKASMVLMYTLAKYYIEKLPWTVLYFFFFCFLCNILDGGVNGKLDVGGNSTIGVSSCHLSTEDIHLHLLALKHSKIKDIVHIDFIWWRIVENVGAIMSSFGQLLWSYLVIFFLENFWSEHFFIAMSHLTTAYACFQMSARRLVVYCLIGLHFDVLPHGTYILVSNVLLLYFMSLNIRDSIDLWTTICSLAVLLVACLFFYGLLS